MKLSIAICDDDINDSTVFSKIICNSIKKHNVEYILHQFTSGYELFQNKEIIDILFLDIELPDMNGMEIANRILENGFATIIIFISNYGDRVYESLRYRPFRFLRKSHLVDEIDEAIEAIIELLDANIYEYSSVELKKSVRLNLSKILYIEKKGHYLIFNELHNKIKIRGTITECESKLKSKGFIKINSGCMVNVKYVTDISNNIVVMRGIKYHNLTVSREKKDILLLEIMKEMRK